MDYEESEQVAGKGWTLAVAGGASGDPVARGGGGPTGSAGRPDRQTIWREPGHGFDVAEEAPGGGRNRVAEKASGSSAGEEDFRGAGSGGDAGDCGPHAGPVEAAVCALDSGGGSGFDREEVSASGFGDDGGALVEELGDDSSEAGAEGV